MPSELARNDVKRFQRAGAELLRAGHLDVCTLWATRKLPGGKRGSSGMMAVRLRMAYREGHLMVDGGGYRLWRAVDRMGLEWAPLAAQQPIETLARKPSNDNFDDLDPFITLILGAAGETAAVRKQPGRCAKDATLVGVPSQSAPVAP